MALKAVRQYEIIKDVNRQGGKRPESFSILRSSEAGGKMREENHEACRQLLSCSVTRQAKKWHKSQQETGHGENGREKPECSKSMGTGQ